MKRAFLGVAILVAGVLLLASAYAGITLWRAHGPAPDWNGDVAIQGLDGAVEILRDENGVAHIFAATPRDAYFAQGFVHAQDRFWQMAIARQTQAGRLSEWFGATMRNQDRANRLQAGEHLADRLWADFPAEEKPLLEAYAAGVNAWLDSDNFRRPPEMTILHVAPERWTARDSFLVLRSIHGLLSGYGGEVGRARAIQNAASPVAVEWIDGLARRITPIVEGPGQMPVQQPTRSRKDGEFSNSWALSGAHTKSGLPLLANDPQLPATTPNFWHLMHLSIAGRSVVGATMPGIPGVILGHNGRIAWGATAALTDANDVALVEGDPDDPTRFRRGPDAPWETFATRPQTLRVRFGRNFEEPIRSTDTGFIVPPDLQSLPFSDAPYALAEYRLLGHDRDRSIAAILRLNQATTAAEAVLALEDFEGPHLNVTIADVEGTIAYTMAGVIAVRPQAHATTVGFGPDDANQWTRLPYAENPRIVNPASGRIVTANQTIIGPEYPHYLGDLFADPVRAERINEVLDARATHDVDSFHAMQRDSLSPIARELAPLLLQAKPANEADARLVRVLRDWDYRFELNSPAPAIYLTWAAMAGSKIGDDELGDFGRGFDVGDRFLVDVLSGPRSHWCNDITTEAVETCAALVTAALTEARLALEAAYGADPATWTWGAVAEVEVPHLGFGQLPVLGNMFSQRTPLAAGPEALFLTAVSTDAQARFDRTSVASSYQVIFDLSALDQSRFMMVGGQSGHFRSPYYNNLTPRWAAGERFMIPTDRAMLNPVATMRLVPGAKSSAALARTN
jgi:penicillin amidase